MSNVRKAKHGWIFTIIFTILSVLWVLPIVIVFMNSFKLKAYIKQTLPVQFTWSVFFTVIIHI